MSLSFLDFVTILTVLQAEMPVNGCMARLRSGHSRNDAWTD
ncbi:hypothetical protein HMPREF0880_01302 [Yokenella regensburgei ATCC 43003]|nr:hypothetical protein HMPREF0880_01302 [Yokenella regensburgei ATCC 43003]